MTRTETSKAEGVRLQSLQCHDKSLDSILYILGKLKKTGAQ